VEAGFLLLQLVVAAVELADHQQVQTMLLLEVVVRAVALVVHGLLEEMDQELLVKALLEVIKEQIAEVMLRAVEAVQAVLVQTEIVLLTVVMVVLV
jgi:hypothetical protein